MRFPTKEDDERFLYKLLDRLNFRSNKTYSITNMGNDQYKLEELFLIDLIINRITIQIGTINENIFYMTEILNSLKETK